MTVGPLFWSVEITWYTVGLVGRYSSSPFLQVLQRTLQKKKRKSSINTQKRQVSLPPSASCCEFRVFVETQNELYKGTRAEYICAWKAEESVQEGRKKVPKTFFSPSTNNHPQHFLHLRRKVLRRTTPNQALYHTLRRKVRRASRSFRPDCYTRYAEKICYWYYTAVRVCRFTYPRKYR